jgi:hypothetical protein
MHVNGKMVSWKYSKTGGMGDKGEQWGVNTTMMYLIYCKNFCKCHDVPPAQH